VAGIEDAMPGQPVVSVLLPTWNAMRFLPAAVESILSQHFEDFECIIVDDGSTDETPKYLRSLADGRIRVLRREANIGVTAALNLGLAQCRGRYIARMDADDIAEPGRLAEQVNLLDEREDVGIVGSSRLLVDEDGNPIAVAEAMPDDLSIRWKCLLGNPLPHPTVMLRHELLQRHAIRYDESYRSAQDYELWTRLLPLTHAANIRAPLLKYRLHRSSISRSRKIEQLANHDRIALLANRRLLPSFPLSADQVTNLRGRYGGKSVREPGRSLADPEWIGLLDAMLHAFCRSHSAAPGIDDYASCQHGSIPFGGLPNTIRIRGLV
jgi:glycosyltransferase involved in cell wall biosynthesis